MRLLRDLWRENTWKANLIVGVVVGVVAAFVTHLDHGRRAGRTNLTH